MQVQLLIEYLKKYPPSYTVETETGGRLLIKPDLLDKGAPQRYIDLESKEITIQEIDLQDKKRKGGEKLMIQITEFNREEEIVVIETEVWKIRVTFDEWEYITKAYKELVGD